MKNAHNILVGTDGKRQLLRFRSRWEDDMKTDLGV
jgi:hypothetical protein